MRSPMDAFQRNLNADILASDPGVQRDIDRQVEEIMQRIQTREATRIQRSGKR